MFCISTKTPTLCPLCDAVAINSPLILVCNFHNCIFCNIFFQFFCQTQALSPHIEDIFPLQLINLIYLKSLLLKATYQKPPTKVGGVWFFGMLENYSMYTTDFNQ